MKILDYLKEEWILPELQGTDKRSILKELSGILVKPCQVTSAEEILQVLLEREKLGSTGIGEGIAIPHGRLKKLKTFFISFGRSIKGVEFDSIDHHPSQLSGGEQQRVAIARALVNQPSILLADEPTGNLDSKTSEEIMAIFQRLNRDLGITIIMITHEPDIAAYSKRVLRFLDGHIVSDEAVKQARRTNS